MNKKEILELIDKNPYWGEDAESMIMIRDLKKWFDFNLKDEDDDDYITKKEFRLEIDRLWNEIRQPTITTHTYDRNILSDRTISVT